MGLIEKDKMSYLGRVGLDRLGFEWNCLYSPPGVTSCWESVNPNTPAQITLIKTTKLPTQS